MLGAIAGDIIGSAYEFKNTKRTDFDLFCPHSQFTDDTILTIAIADSILSGKSYASTIREYGRRYPNGGYGNMFAKWLRTDDAPPYHSMGNGSAMRVSPVGFAYETPEKVLDEAMRSAVVTHNHPEGIKGAQATAMAVFLARKGEDKKNIKLYIEKHFKYDLGLTLDEIRPHYKYSETCEGSVPQAIMAFLGSNDYEDAVRKAVSLGGDSDTIACITGGIAHAYYKEISGYIVENVRRLLMPDLLVILDSFSIKYRL